MFRRLISASLAAAALALAAMPAMAGEKGAEVLDYKV